MKLFFCFLLMLALPLSAQQQRLKEKSQDVFEELETGGLTLRFFNALTGQPIEGGSVAIENSGTYETDNEGKVVFPAPEEDGQLQVTFECEGYISTAFPVEVMAGTLFFNRVSISPSLDLRFLRVVVDWEKEPRDLDAHFLKLDGYHISYRDMHTLADGSGTLDRDAMNGYGPETITVKEVSRQARYQYSIHDYSDRTDPRSTGLSRSKATVKVYGEGRLLNVFSVPAEGEGTTWHVFQIVNGEIRPIGIIE